jgi:hypothetical protein
MKGWRRGSKRFRPAAAVVASAFVLVSGARAQTTWEPLESGVDGESITAIDYQSSDRFWIATANRVLKRSGGTFAAQLTVPGANFREIQFNPAGTVGIAVGGRRMWRFAAAMWTEVTGLETYKPCLGHPLTPIPLAEADVELTNVRWTDPGTVFALTGGRTLLKSTDAGVTFREINIQPDGSCRINSGIEDVFVLPQDSAYMVFLTSQGTVYVSTNRLGGKAPVQGWSVSCFGNRLFVDERNPLNTYLGGRGCGYFVYAEDGKTFEGPQIVGDRGGHDVLYDFDVNGSTTLSAGDAGYILTSVDHRTAYVQHAAGTYATQDWRAVDLASPSEGAIGGTGGALAVSRNVDATPPPTSTPGSAPTTAPTATVRPTPTPTPTPTRRSRPSAPSKRVVIKFKSGFYPPPGISRSRACTGGVTVRLRVRRRTLASRSTHLNRRCRYSVRFELLRARLRGARRVQIVARFRGNRVLGARTATYTQRVPR